MTASRGMDEVSSGKEKRNPLQGQNDWWRSCRTHSVDFISNQSVGPAIGRSIANCMLMRASPMIKAKLYDMWSTVRGLIKLLGKKP